MVQITMISVLFLMTDSFCLWKTQFTEQTFSMPSNWQITGAYSGNRVSNCQGQNIVGGFNIVGSGSVIRGTYSNIPRHSAIKVRLKVYYIDSWDTEDASISAGGFVTSRTWYLDWGPSNVCGAGYKDGVIWETLQGAHTAETLTITLNPHGLDESADNESLGLKNVEIYLKPIQCIQFFTECDYTGTMKEFCEDSPNQDRRNIPQKIKSIKMHGCGKVTLTKKGLGSITITENVSCLTEFDFPPVENLNR